ncbi:ribonuclease H family protein [Tessaracoccus sp. Z1128]
MIVAAADGSALSNPGPAGWAWYVSDDIWAAGGWDHGTNNMGELMAVLDLLRSTAHLDEPLRILCDSQYVINSLTKWLPGWKRKGWKKGDGKPVLNVELMKELDLALQGRSVQFEWVKGHAGHAMNEAADVRARAAATAFQRGEPVDAGPGFPATARPAGRSDFSVGQKEPEPDLFSLDAEAPGAPRPVPGSAPPRTKAALIRLTRAAVADPPAAPLHHEFVAHTVDGTVSARAPWPPGDSLDLLGVDTLGAGAGLTRWQADGILYAALWLELPVGWRLRFAQASGVSPRR